MPASEPARDPRRPGLRELGAGLALSTLLVPAGMGYAVVAGLPPVAGLYATVAGLLAYVVVGPRPLLVVGPDSSLSPMVAAAVLPLAATGSPTVGSAAVLAVLVGGILLAASALHLGFVTELLSKPIRLGFLHGVIGVVVIGQIPAMLGFDGSSGSVVEEVRGIGRGIAHGGVRPPAAAIAVGSLLLVVLLRRWRPSWPSMLAVLVASVAAVRFTHADVPTVGALPRTFPTGAFAGVRWGDVVRLVPAALGLSLVAFADSASLARAFSADDAAPARTGTDTQMRGLGAANVAAGAVGGLPVSASMSRTAVAHAVGAQTPLAIVVGASMTALLLVAGPGLTTWLPRSALAAIVVGAVATMTDVAALARLRRMSNLDFGLAAATTAGVLVWGALIGIAVAVGLSLAAFVGHVWRPHTAELGRIDHRKGYHDLERHPEGSRIPGLALVRFDAPLFFANAELFAAFVRRTVDASSEPVRWVLVAAEPITEIDVTAAEVLACLAAELRGRHVRLAFAELKGPIVDELERYGLRADVVGEQVFPTIGSAVSAYVKHTRTPWHDWTDEPSGS